MIVRMFVALLLTAAALAQGPQQPPANAEAAKLVELPAEVPANATRYAIQMMGNKAGVEADWRTPDGAWHSFYGFNDRGRGPRISETATLAPDGTIISVTVAGNDYLKTAVEESFTLAGGKASWKNQAEQGEKRLSGPADYISMNGTPAELGWLARALLQAGGRLALLPAGEARVEKFRDLTVSANGKSQAVTAYGITGLDLSPTIVWLDGDKNLFALGSSWLSVIREGWEPAAKALEDAQKQIEVARAEELARRLPHRPTGPVVFDDVTVFDSERAVLAPHQRVIVAGNRIQSVSAANGTKLPDGAQVIDGRGKTLLPGLWDMHAHVSPNDGLLNLAAGVTTVRDMANDNDELTARRKRIEAGQEVGTRIVAAGFIDGPGPYQGPTKVLAGNEQQAREYVRMYAAMGYPQIKIYSSLKPELVPAIVDEARRHGMRVSGHIPAGMTASEAVRDGYNEIQHINFVFLNFMPDVKNTQTPARFTEPAKRAAELDLNSQPVKDFIALLKQNNIAVDVTLDAFENMLTGRAGVVPPAFRQVADRLPPQVRRGLLTGGLPVPPGMEQRYRDSYAAFLKMTKLLYDSGVQLETGTDDFAGFAFERELELHAQAGIPAAKVLQNATWDAARIMKRDQVLGSIRAGKLADVVLVDGDPVADISIVRRVVLTMKDGVIYRPEELYEALGIAAAAAGSQ